MTTIRDVAKLAGVGVGTASRAFSSNGSVSDGARAAVLQAAKKLNFTPSPTARSLSTGRTGLIGVLVPQFDAEYFAIAISVAEREIRAAGRHMVVMSASGDAAMPWSDALGMESLIERRVDGILHLSTRHSERELVLAAEKGPHIAIVNRMVKSLSDVCYSVDHYAAGQMVADYLLKRGHRKFATITGPLAVDDAHERHSGFVDRLSMAGTAIDPDLIAEGDFYMEGGRAGAERLFANGKEFTALFCGNDLMAISAQAYLAMQGLQPTVVGYDNNAILDLAGLKISSVDIPIADMVRNGVWSLLARCYGDKHTLTQDFGTRIVERQ